MSLIQNLQLIVGLGNPGNEYNSTWHNIGFMFVNYLRDNLDKDFSIINKKDYELAYFPASKLSLVKPLKFMNRSGEVVAEILKFKDITPDKVLIVHDDLDLQFGEFKIQQGKYPKSHNGILSIHERTGETEFNYLRIGIETRDEELRNRFKGEDYVLSQIPKERAEEIEEVFREILNSLKIH